MVAHWSHQVRLSSAFIPGNRATPDLYRLTVFNGADVPVSGFKLGFSGPARIADSATLTGGSVVMRLSNYCEIAPGPGFILQPDACWSVSIDKLDYALQHWTDGAVYGFLVTADGTAHALPTEPTRLEHSAEPHRRGVMRLKGKTTAPATILPWPAEIAISGRRSVPQGFVFEADSETAGSVVEVFAALANALFPGAGLVRGDAEDGCVVRVALDSKLGGEAYRITFATDSVAIAGGSSAGLLYGLITLGQVQRGSRLDADMFSFPTGGYIADAPAHGWRGMHLDVARRFYSTEEVKQFLRIMAWNKLNRFHWHLSDDEAWRVEIDAFPALTAIGAWRGFGLPIPPLLGSGPERAGGFYTKAAITEIVALAAELGIEIIPEIDVPGHCFALLQALPHLRDAGENGLYESIQSFPNNCLNPGVEAVYAAVETIFAEMLELFPSRWFHVGADEVPHEAWATSPLARTLLETTGGDGPAPLQAHFLKRVQAFLTANGRITGAWEEARDGGGIDREDCYLVGWTTVAASQELAREGYDVVVAPGQTYYLDMANGPEWAEPGAHWAGWSSPAKAYAFDPATGWSAAERERLLGVQGCVWSEPMADRAVFDRLVFPRLSAIAETGWTAPERKDFARFSVAANLMPSLYGTTDMAGL
ncbi:MAG: beta-N-acetylhexosaminidase [Devosia sp.]|nr:beta-N-acetylhexosaminidase [Devosia sp.]